MVAEFAGADTGQGVQRCVAQQLDGIIRALECLSTVSAAHNEPALGVQYAAEIVALEPFRETGYQQLMRMHAAAGNRAEALRVFANCRELLREELGVSSSPRTEAVFLEILRDESFET